MNRTTRWAAAAATVIAMGFAMAGPAYAETPTVQDTAAQVAGYADMTLAQRKAVDDASAPVYRRLTAVDASGTVVSDTGLVAIDPDTGGLAVHGDLLNDSAGASGATSGATSIDFYECIYGIFENTLACYHVPTQWSWNGAQVTASHYSSGDTHYFFWEYNGNSVDQQTPSLLYAGAVHIVSGGKFCYRVGFSFLSGCLQNWYPTFDITVAAGGAYAARDISSTPF